MIYKVIETEYKGFRLILDESDRGWNAIIGSYAVKFSTMNDAHVAINRILDSSKDILKKYGGKVICRPPDFGAAKMVEEEKPY